MKQLRLLFILVLVAVCGSSSLKAQTFEWVLTTVRVDAIPDNAGFLDTPDMYFIMKLGTNVQFTSSTVDDTDPPVSWSPNVSVDSTQSYTIEVWDADAIDPDDDLGIVTIPGKGMGDVVGTVSGATGQLELHYDYTLTVGLEEELVAVNLTVGPNPVEDVVYLDLEMVHPVEMNLSLIDQQGKKVYAETLGTQIGLRRHAVELSDFANGVYSLRIEAGGAVLHHKIMIAH